jgi:hypothetical protein
MNENVHTLRLYNYLSAGEGWGRAAGARARAKLRQQIDAKPASELVRLALSGVRKLDVTFAVEAVVSLVQDYAGTRQLCLTDPGDPDVSDNIAAAATLMNRPITLWTGSTAEILGPAPNIGLRGALEFALVRSEVRAAEFAKASGVSSANASSKYRQLADGGYLLRRQATMPSGGTEYVYRRIC